MKRSLAILMAVVFALALMGTAQAGETGRPSELKNVFNANYGTGEEDLHRATELDGGDFFYCLPTVYTVDTDESIYVLDRGNAASHMPIKHYDKDSNYLNTITSEIFIDEIGKIVDIYAHDKILYVINDDSVFYSYNTDTKEVKKFEPGCPEDYRPYALIYTDGHITIAYRQNQSPYMMDGVMHMEYRNFDIKTERFTENEVSVRYYTGDDGERMTEFDWYGTKYTLKSALYEMPLGINSLGELVIWQYKKFDRLYEYYTYDVKTGELAGVYSFEGLMDYEHNVRMENGTLLTAPDYSDDAISEYKIEVIPFADGEDWVPVYPYTLPIIPMGAPEEVDEKYLTARESAYMVEPNAGPSGFAITESGDVYVQERGDFINAPALKHYKSDGTFAEKVDTDVFDEGDFSIVSQMAVKGNTLYMLGRINPKGGDKPYVYCFCEFDTQAKTWQKYDLPENETIHSMLGGFETFALLGDYAVFCDSASGYNVFVVFDTVKKEFVNPADSVSSTYDRASRTQTIKIDDTTYTFICGGVDKIIGLDTYGNLIVTAGGSLRQYSKDGKLTAIADSYDDCELDLLRRISITGGKVYRARTTKRVYSIDELVFNDKYLSENIYDANCDSKEDTQDAVYILKYAAGMITLTPAQKAKADISCDDQVRTDDAVMVLRHSAGM